MACPLLWVAITEMGAQYDKLPTVELKPSTHVQ